MKRKVATAVAAVILGLSSGGCCGGDDKDKSSQGSASGATGNDGFTADE